jgi:hypothetical protein
MNLTVYLVFVLRNYRLISNKQLKDIKCASNNICIVYIFEMI